MVSGAAVVAVCWLVYDVWMPLVEVRARNRQIKSIVHVGDSWDAAKSRLGAASFAFGTTTVRGAFLEYPVEWKRAHYSQTLELMWDVVEPLHATEWVASWLPGSVPPRVVVDGAGTVVGIRWRN